jgi:hypothetical protein
MYTQGALMMDASTGKTFIQHAKRIGMTGDSPAQAANFSRSDGGFVPTEYNIRGKFFRHGGNGVMVYPNAGDDYTAKKRDEMWEEGERAEELRKRGGKTCPHYKAHRELTGATGANAWIPLLDVYERVNGRRMELTCFWWTDAMHASLVLRAHVWPTLSGERAKLKKPRNQH